MHPLLRNWRDDRAGTFVRAAAVFCGLVVVSVFCAWIAQPASSRTPAERIAEPGWSTVERPYAAFALTIPEASGEPVAYEIRRHAKGGRKDVVTLGTPNSETPYLRVEVYRPGGEAYRFGDAASEIIAHAELTPMQIATMPQPVGSKFGDLQVAKFVTADNRHCVGFTRAYDDPKLQMVGWFCQGGDYVQNATLSCALDRFNLVAAGSEPKVTALFAQAELNRTFCNQKSPLLVATPKYTQLWKALGQSVDASARAQAR